MVNAQEWLEKNYPNKETRRIDINQQLEGVLDCSEYKRLWYIFISSQIDSSKFEIKKGSYEDWNIKNNIKETKIIPCISAQGYLDKEYTKNGTCIRKEQEYDYESRSYKEKNHQDFGKKREEIKGLYIGEIGLEGSLDLSDFTNLEQLSCDANCLTTLNLNNCQKLRFFGCYNNQLTTLDLSNLEELKEIRCNNNYLTQIVYPVNPKKLTDLYINDNNLNSDLSIFSLLRNLRFLSIDNNSKNQISLGIYNRFIGSLEPLKDLNDLQWLDISNTDIDSGWEYLPTSLGSLFYKTELRPNCKLAQTKLELEKEIWVDIREGFTPKCKKEWLDQDFNKERTKKFLAEWNKNIELIRPWDGKFINWYLKFKELDLNWALENEEDFKDLRDNHRHFGTCDECKQPNTGGEYGSGGWCQSCNSKHFQTEFKNWTSGNQNIDKFIQKCQLETTNTWNILEWIPYEKFNNINHIADGGFGKVYKAKWEGGSIRKWDNEKMEWGRQGDYDTYNRENGESIYKNYQTVALKTLTNSQNIDQDFLSELTLYKMFKSEASNMVPCYGISKDKEGNYIMVMQYMKEGNLRDYLKKNRELKFYYSGNKYGKTSKLNFLQQIVQGLKDIHRKGLVHRDFHSGNIIVGGGCCITDLGLSRPVDEVDSNQVYGLMPYVAPEVLQREPYTEATDIYSLGMIMYEILTGLPPFCGEEHDINLSLMICQGTRPKFPEQVKYPQILVNLIRKCWDQEPYNRPTVWEISDIFREWLFNDYQDWNLKIGTEFYYQCKEAKTYNLCSALTKYYQQYRSENKEIKPEEVKTIKKELLAEFCQQKGYEKDENGQYSYEAKREFNKLLFPPLDIKIHEGTVWHSKKINTNKINELLQSKKQFGTKDLDFNLDMIEELNIQEDNREQNWQNINSNFTDELVKKWQDLNFAPNQVKEWINIGLQPMDANFVAWLRDIKGYTPEWVLNHGNQEQIKQEFFIWWQEQQQAQIEQSPK